MRHEWLAWLVGWLLVDKFEVIAVSVPIVVKALRLNRVNGLACQFTGKGCGHP